MSDENSAEMLYVLGHKVTPIVIGGRIAAVDVRVDPSLPGPPPHHHVDAAEYFYMLEGDLEILSEGEWHAVATGDYFVVPGNVVHTFRTPGDEPARFITGWEPEGFERFFVECGIPADEADAATRSAAEDMIPRVLESFARNGAVPADPVAAG